MNLLPHAYNQPSRVVSGNETIASLATESLYFGDKGLIIHGNSFRKNGCLDQMEESFPPDVRVNFYEHTGEEPTLKHLGKSLEAARKCDATWIAGIGGGSVMDLAKACAGLFNASDELVVYHDGAEPERCGIPFIAVPTTAGTGSEATVNSVLINSGRGQKKSIRHPTFMANLIILDSDLLESCPEKIIAYSGMDAFTQALESFTSRKATWLSDAFALKALKLISKSLEPVYNGANSEKREQLLFGSYFAGYALNLARLGVVHGLAHPLGVRYHLPHGLVCAFCLPHALRLNKIYMAGKYDEMAQLLGGDPVTKVESLLQAFAITSPLKGQQVQDKEGIIKETLNSGSTAANPKKIDGKDIETLLKHIFE